MQNCLLLTFTLIHSDCCSKEHLLICDFSICGLNFQGNDCLLAKHGMLQLKYLYYRPGDCLFYALVVLFHFLYSSTEIKQGRVNPFRTCLDRKDPKALRSMKT